MELTMYDFLDAIDKHGTKAREHLLDSGVPQKVLTARAMKASRKGYTDFGVVADRGWLTDKGRAFLAEHRP